ncbi:MAG: DUF1104 domain-containing protein [Nitrospirae bacterium]|nr:DUF1104 domain-containing protein [Nitrospirota bacterium]
MIKKISIFAGALLFTASALFAADYSTMSTEELASMRGKMQNATVQERSAFQNEWQKRVQTMSAEDRQKYLGRPQGAGQGAAPGSRGANKPGSKGFGGRGGR